MHTHKAARVNAAGDQQLRHVRDRTLDDHVERELLYLAMLAHAALNKLGVKFHR
jgi:hypothetical protein